jgi:hypothetical protein
MRGAGTEARVTDWRRGWRAELEHGAAFLLSAGAGRSAASGRTCPEAMTVGPEGGSGADTEPGPGEGGTCDQYYTKSIALHNILTNRRFERPEACMSATSVTLQAEVVSPEGRVSTVLKRDALGLPSLFFCIATAAAPMTALLFNVPVISSRRRLCWAAPASARRSANR